MQLLHGRRGRQCVSAFFILSAIAFAAGLPSAYAQPRQKERAHVAAHAPAQEAAAVPSAAAAASAAAAPSAGAAPSAARRQLDALNTAKTDVAALRNAQAEAKAEAKEASFGALVQSSSRYRDQLHQIAADLTSAAPPEGTPEEQAALASSVGSELGAEAERLPSEIRESSALVQRLFDEAIRAKADAVHDLAKRSQHALASLAMLVTDLHENLAARALLKQDTGASKAQFQQLLTDVSALTARSLRTVIGAIGRLDGGLVSKLEPGVIAQRDTLSSLRSLLTDSQRKYIDYMEEQGLDTVQVRQELISASGEVSKDILDTDVLKGLAGEWKSGAVRWASEHAANFAFRLFSFVLILAAFSLLARFAQSVVRRAMARAGVKLSTLASEFFVTSTRRIVWLLGFVIAAAQLGVEVGPLIAGLGIAGFVAGFALQDTLSNFAAGMMILVYRPFDVGDLIEAGGVSGVVMTMTLVYTRVLTADNQMLIVPNNKIWGGVIRNVTSQAERRVDLQFSVSYRDDLAHAEHVLSSIVRDNPRVLAEPAPVVKLHELGDSCAKFVVRPWVKTADYWDAYWEITREVKQRFDAEGLAIPLPQRDLHIYEERLLERGSRESQSAPTLAAAG